MLTTVMNRAGVRSNLNLSHRSHPFPGIFRLLRKHSHVRHSPRRQSVVLKIAARLLHQAERTGLGQVFHAPCNVLLDRNVVVQPDIFFVHNRHRGIVGKDQVYGIPDLAIDVQSSPVSSVEYVARRKSYLRFGVPELWLINPDRRMAEAFLWSELGYVSTGVYRESGQMKFTRFPELGLSLAGLFQ